MTKSIELMARAVAAIAIVGFWCISAVRTTLGTTVGVTSLAAAVAAATSTTAEAGRRRRAPPPRRRGNDWEWYWWQGYEDDGGGRGERGERGNRGERGKNGREVITTNPRRVSCSPEQAHASAHMPPPKRSAILHLPRRQGCAWSKAATVRSRTA